MSDSEEELSMMPEDMPDAPARFDGATKLEEFKRPIPKRGFNFSDLNYRETVDQALRIPSFIQQAKDSKRAYLIEKGVRNIQRMYAEDEGDLIDVEALTSRMDQLRTGIVKINYALAAAHNESRLKAKQLQTFLDYRPQIKELH